MSQPYNYAPPQQQAQAPPPQQQPPAEAYQYQQQVPQQQQQQQVPQHQPQQPMMAPVPQQQPMAPVVQQQQPVAPAPPQQVVQAPAAAPVQQQQQQPSGGFDLDDLLGTGPTTKPAPAPQQAPPPPPDHPPPPPVNHDPFFGGAQAPAPVAPAPVQQQQQPAAAPQQVPQQQAYTYAPGVQQPPVHPPMQPVQQVVQQPAPVQPQPQQQPQQQLAATPYSYNPAPAPGAAPHGAPQQPPLAGAPTPWHPPTTLTQPGAPQPQSVQGHPAHPGVQPPQQQPQPVQAFHPGFDANSYTQRDQYGNQQQPGGAPAGYSGAGGYPAAGGASNAEDADRAHLEQIMKLRRDLEAEQDRSKAKVEDGTTWPCPTCTYKNKLDIVECDICGAGRPGYSSAKVRQQDPAPAAARPPPPVVEARPPPPPVVQQGAAVGKWECSTCTFHNDSSAPKCSMCGTNNPNPSRAPAGTVVNAQPIAGGAGGSGSPAGAGTTNAGGWPCPTCTFESPFTKSKCTMCGTPMPEQFKIQAQIAAQQQRLMQGGGYPAEQAAPAGRGAAPRATPTAGGRSATGGESAGNEDEVQWQDDKVVTNCNKCNNKFTMVVRRHHCRSCGFVFCNSCSSNKLKLKSGGAEERVCIDCYREKLGKPIQ